MTRGWQVILLAVVVSGCGYALAGRGNTLPDDIRRIGVPTFQNLSTTPDLDRIFTEAVRVELQSRGKYKVVPETTGVDAVLSGSIRLGPPEVTAFTSAQQASKISITVIASAEFKLTRDNKIFWSTPALRVSDEYDVIAGTSVNDLAALFTQAPNAIDRLAKAFARSLVQSILEAF